MERDDQVNLPVLQANAPIQTSTEDYLQWQQHTPRAMLAAVTHGENGLPPQLKPGADTTPKGLLTTQVTTSSTEKYPFDDEATSGGDSPPRRERHDPYGRTGGVNIARPPRVRSVHDGAMHRPDGDVLPPLRRGGSGLDWVVPISDVNHRNEWIKDGLGLVLKEAVQARKDSNRTARLNGWILNIAISLQVLLGALVTGLSSTIKPSKVGATTTALGALTTLVASYLARMRGSSEPDQSIKRTDRLDHLIRAIQAFKLDYSRKSATEQETKLEEFRYLFEDIMRNPNHAATTTAGANATAVVDADETGKRKWTT